MADIDYVEGLKDYIKIHLGPQARGHPPEPEGHRGETATLLHPHPQTLPGGGPKITAIKRECVCIGKREIPVSDSYKDNLTKILNRPGDPVA